MAARFCVQTTIETSKLLIDSLAGSKLAPGNRASVVQSRYSRTRRGPGESGSLLAKQCQPHHAAAQKERHEGNDNDARFEAAVDQAKDQQAERQQVRGIVG